jgi:hypothetical protein
MPRQQTLQIEGRPIIDLQGPTVGTQVVAHPVDTFVDQGMAQKMAHLQNFLEAGQSLVGAIDAKDRREGAQDAALGKEQQRTGLLGGYEAGWLSQRGAVAGAEDASKALTDYDTGFDRNNPSGLEGWITQKTQQLTQGMQDGPYKQAYLAKLADGMNAIRGAHVKEQADWKVATAETDATTLLKGSIDAIGKAGKAITPEDYVNINQTLRDKGLNFDPKRFDELARSALAALAADGNMQAVDAAAVPGPDGKLPFPTIKAEDMAQLKHHAMAAYTSKINAQWTAQEHEWKMKENTAMGPIIQMAHSGDVASAQAELDKLNRQGFFLAHPEDLDKWQKLTISTGDRAMTLSERKTWNAMYEGIWLGKVGPHDIVHADLPPKDTKDLTMVYMDWWKQQQANIAAGKHTDALANLFKNQVAMATLRARLDALPQIPDAVKGLDFGGVLTNKVEEIRADATQRMYQSMADAKGDEVAFERSSSRIAELTSKHIQDVLRINGANESTRDWWLQKPAYINHDSWEGFVKDYEAGLVPKDPELVSKTYTWFRQAKGRR